MRDLTPLTLNTKQLKVMAKWDQLFSPHPWNLDQWQSLEKKGSLYSAFSLTAVNKQERREEKENENGFDPWCLFLMSGEEADLLKVLVHPTHQGRGLGKALLKKAFQEIFEKRGHRKIFIEHEAKRADLAHFYGLFRPIKIGLRKNYYGPGLHAQTLLLNHFPQQAFSVNH